MPRPRLCRWVRFHPKSSFFKPSGIPMKFLDEISLSIDELEALRLADFEGFYQDEAAKRMGISRQTFGRMLVAAHRKIAGCLVQGKALRIQGGDFVMIPRRFSCKSCGHVFKLARGIPRPSACPQCGSVDIFRTDEERSFGEGGSFRSGQRRENPDKGGFSRRVAGGRSAGMGVPGRGGAGRGGGGGRRRGFGRGRGGQR